MLRIGIDVGGTNTDAVLVRVDGEGKVAILSSSKRPTTPDVTEGICRALQDILEGRQSAAEGCHGPVQLVSIGTTHLINAVLQRRGLARTSVIRLGRPSTSAVPPFADWPGALREAVRCRYLLADGGFNYDGATVISEPCESQIKAFAALARTETGCRHFAVTAVFSPVRPDQELLVGRWIAEAVPDASVTLSHQVGQLGFLERENAAILNECLKPTCARAVRAFQAAVRDAGLACPLLLTLGDGTGAAAPDCFGRPVSLLSSGPTNSMRGAALLTGLSDAIVVDIGGTTTDVGLLVGGFPKPAAARIRVGGVATNFALADVTSIALGGGSIVTSACADVSEAAVRLGPDSVGYRLSSTALVFGGDTPTLTDVAVASTCVRGIGDPDILRRRLQGDKELESLLKAAHAVAIELLDTAVDTARVSKAELPVVLVGGGAALFSGLQTLAGLPVRVPPEAGVVNAVGAALCQVGGRVEATLNLSDPRERPARLAGVKAAAVDAAVARGAAREATRLAELLEIQLPYVPGGACRVIAKAVGEIELVAVARLGASEVTTASNEGVSEYDDSESSPAPSSLGASDTDAIPTPTPRSFDPEDGAWMVSSYDAHCLSVGAGLLGCGGGGSPYIGRLTLQAMLDSGRRPRIVQLDQLIARLGLDALTGLPAFMGSPTVLIEKLPSGEETAAAIQLLSQVEDLKSARAPGERLQLISEPVGGWRGQGLRFACLASAEIGGLNSLEPLVAAARLDLPVLDADGIGRAFPELQMFLPLIGGCSPAPAAAADEFGRGAVIFECDSAKELESRFRELCAARGCSVAVAMCPLTLRQCRDHLLLGSYTRAWRLGDGVLRARASKSDPIEAVGRLLNGRVLVRRGKITDVLRVTHGGFARGSVVVMTDGGRGGSEICFEMAFQNEYLLIKRLGAPDSEAEACTPDLVMVMDADTGEPVTTEELRYGLRVAVLAAPSHPRMATEAALAVVGPAAFGFAEVTYRPCGEYPAEDDGEAGG